MTVKATLTLHKGSAVVTNVAIVSGVARRTGVSVRKNQPTVLTLSSAVSAEIIARAAKGRLTVVATDQPAQVTIDGRKPERVETGATKVFGIDSMAVTVKGLAS